MARVEYNCLSKAKVNDKRNIVVSVCSKGGYTIAQQVMVDDGKQKTGVFLKNAIHVDDIEGLVNLRDALNISLEELKKD